MKNRQAFELRVVMALYNFLAVTLSAYMFIKVSAQFFILIYKFSYSMIDLLKIHIYCIDISIGIMIDIFTD